MRPDETRDQVVDQLITDIFSLQHEHVASADSIRSELHAYLINDFMEQLLCYVVNHFLCHLSQTLHTQHYHS